MSQTARAISLVLLSAFTAFSSANAESHTVTFTNNCGSGTPIMIHHGSIVSYGGPYTVQGPLTAAIAYLQTGNCLFDGPNCATVELTLVNTASGPQALTFP
ncbi:hypothetical protein BD779DRAFT_879649 [Infundibulicybe gibba]|nr:hypothetical protein BD779DRAFT_879649 [Infundibulicybe gibba]